MVMTLKEKELVNMGASVATGCKPCTDYHFEKLRKAEADDEDIRRAISDALAVRDAAKKIMESHGLHHLGLPELPTDLSVHPETRVQALVCIGAAFAVNFTTSVQRYMAAGRDLGKNTHWITAEFVHTSPDGHPRMPVASSSGAASWFGFAASSSGASWRAAPFFAASWPGR